ncbi:hypothetical protein C21_02878 [Arenibacter sp. NBRC 103722]|nr:hypothetical protein C21_02878 [Arenibacter sp. NBRC 103722]
MCITYKDFDNEEKKDVILVGNFYDFNPVMEDKMRLRGCCCSTRVVIN